MAAADVTTEPAAGDDPIATLRATMHTLVWPGGCAWHAVQTHATLTPYLVEESAEFIDAIERGAPAGDVASELGDVLYQVLFHAAIAERDGEGYDFAEVARVLNAKLIARHPHVFGDRGHMTVEELNAEWERLKEDAAGERRGTRGVLEGIPAGMPTLARAAKVVDRLARAGRLDPALPPAAPALGAETAEVAEVDETTEVDETALGDALLHLVIAAQATGLDPDRALRLATARLAARAVEE